jgi:osmotically-inducible protein OsmY
MLATPAKTDTDLKLDVLAELRFEPSVKMTSIGVLVKDGVVTLNGRTSDYGEKLNVIKAVRRVSGVMAIADDIEINLPEFGKPTDGDIATAAANRIAWSGELPDDAVVITVRGGRITLEGVLAWGYQKQAAESAVQHLAGVKGIDNLIEIKPSESTGDIGAAIRAALKRSAILDDADIQVETSGSCVVLNGKVHNHAELDEAVRLAWAAPGVHSVQSLLTVNWFWGLAD